MSTDTTGGAGATNPLSGKTLGGRFKVGAPISSGPLGVLLHATDTKGEAPVAIRVPGGALLAETDLTVHWADAIKALATVDHPHLVKTLGGGLEDGAAWAAVRHVGGGSLEDLLASGAGRPSAADVSTWLGKVAGALDALHGAGIVHRGVRPSAILFDAAGQPFLSDATLGRALDPAETNALATIVSPAAANYFAPEASTPAPVGPAFDQYALAVVAYEALSGRLPFHGQTGAAAAVVRQAKAAQPLLEVVPTVPPACAAAVMTALERSPAARHPSCAAFAKASAAGVAAAPVATGGGAGAAGSETKFAAGRGPAAPAAPAAPAKSDPNATRIIPKAGAKAAPAANLPAGAAPRRSGPSKVLVALLVLLSGAAAAAALLFRSEEAPEKPVTIEIASPTEGAMVTSPDVLIRGTFSSPRKTDVLKVEGLEVLSTDGRFERLVTLSQEGKHKIAVTVEAAGKVKKRVDWIVTYNALWRPFVEEAKRLAEAGNFLAAKEKLATAKAKGASEKDLLPDVVAAIARYEAPPSLAITAPADGATFDKPKVVVEGTFASGRPSDRVYVDGVEVVVEEGRFKRPVVLAEGEHEIFVTVKDGETTRKMASVRASYVPPPKPPEPFEAWLSTWAKADGEARDAATGYPVRVIRTKDGGAMVLVPAGEFWMGSTRDAKTVLEGEKPGHKVTISKAYYMDVAPVTLAQWRRYVASGEGKLPNLAFKETKDEMPIYNVTQLEATTFTRWAGVFLPTEAQWERAAKGGDDERVFPWGAADDQAKRNAEGPSDGFEQWAPAKSFEANAYGLYGMAGNVWQWCADWYDPKYYVGSERTDPTGPAEGTLKALRGGAWDSPGFKLRVCHRHAFDPKFSDRTIGFRCVRSLP